MKAITRHLACRAAFFIIGVLLLYAPSALLIRVLLALRGSTLQPDVHRICLRMPFEWLLQPWMYPTLFGEPLYLVGIVALPGLAFFFGPLFCGWLCPAGAFTEFSSRLVPERFKFDPAGRLNPAPLRYGVFVGMLLSPFLGGYICCTFCNFTMMQNVVSATAGDLIGMATWTSFTIITFVLWMFALGMFVKGGRGWCNLICPAGALQGLLHAVGARLGISRAVHIDMRKCTLCRECLRECPAWAITDTIAVNRHACNLCLDCLHHCPTQAIAYRKIPQTKTSARS